MIYKIVALVIIVLLLVVNYSVLVIASKEEERVEQMYRAWREKYEQDNS